MEKGEGVIKYRLHFKRAAPPTWKDYPRLEAWRRILFRLGLIGKDPVLYGGLGYGNISERVQNGFIITATQTGSFEQLEPEYYCLVQEADCQANYIVAQGMHPPSSEALTHAAIYQASGLVQVVMHGHCPEIWHKGTCLGLMCTPHEADYGTPDMARAVQSMVKAQPGQGMIIMGGHRDGFLAYGRSHIQAGVLVVETLAQVWAMS